MIWILSSEPVIQIFMGCTLDEFMESLTEYLTFNTKTRRAFVNITSQIEKLVKKSNVKEGLCLVNAMHITASVFINDNEGGLHND